MFVAVKPLGVEILSREQPLSVGRKSELWCKTMGARPPATITWWLGGKRLEAITKDSVSVPICVFLLPHAQLPSSLSS